METSHPLRFFSLVLLALPLCKPLHAQDDSGRVGLEPVRADRVQLRGFWSERQETLRTVTLPLLFEQLNENGAIEAFDIAAGKKAGSVEGPLTRDAEVYRWIEAASRAIGAQEDSALKAKLDFLVPKIIAAQKPDGYISTPHAFVAEDQRYANTRSGYELFCAGHLIEAALAHHAATGQSELLDAAKRLADHLDEIFGPRKKRDVPGHAGVELALLELARVTSEPRYSKLARFFLLERGSENRRRRHGPFAQDHEPLLDQSFLQGHAVRAMYLYAGLAELALTEETDDDYLSPLISIAHDAYRRHMYVTGGLGHTAHDHGFEDAYEMPNDKALCETSTAVGIVRWSHRMALLTQHPTYADAVERTLLNNLQAGISWSGDQFAHTNPLEWSSKDAPRSKSPEPSTAPTDAARELLSVADKLYAHDDKNIYMMLYADSEARISLPGGEVRLIQETNYPLEGRVLLRVEPDAPTFFTLHVRVPGWCKRPFTLGVNDSLSKMTVTHGADPGLWFTFERAWKSGDTMTLEFPFEFDRVTAHRKVKACAGQVALQRGPIVYAFEAVDNGGNLHGITLDESTPIQATWDAERLGGVFFGRFRALRGLASDGKPSDGLQEWFALPYFLWGQRDPSAMRVWIPRTGN